MDKFFIVTLAYRNLKSHKLRTLLTLLGVVIGISAIIFLLSFAYGIERLVTREVSKGNALLLLDVGVGNSQIVKINEETIGNIKNISHVSNIEVMTAAAAKSKIDDKVIDLGFFGTTDRFLDWSGTKIKSGNYFSSEAKPEIVINTAFSEFLNSTLGKELLGKTLKLDLIVPKELADQTEDIHIPESEFTITGILQDDTSPKAYTNYSTLEKFGLHNFTQLKIEIDNSTLVKEVRMQIENMGLKTQYVGDTINQIEQVFSIFKVILAGFGAITLIVSLLGMFNTLTISLLERIKEIALMKIMGMRKRDIHQIFLTESMILGIAGGIIGISFGLACSKSINLLLNKFAIEAGGEAVTVFYYPLILVIGIFFVSFAIGFLTGIYPAKKATKVDSLEVLRYE